MSDQELWISDPEKWLHEASEKYELFCVVMFRGSWCKYDEAYLQKIAKDPLKPVGTHMVAWTSEGPEGAKKAATEWKLLDDYDFVLGDDTNSLAEYLVEDELLPKLETVPIDEAKLSEDKMYGPVIAKYPKGMVQPGIIIYAHKGNMCFHWEAKATEENAFGAANRPLPSEIWKEVKHRKKALDHGNAVMPIHGDRLKTCLAPDDV
eukprot:CAMPEP_0116869152 /NCGR_PEP_ID=MMETSP0418-20121206/27598_1 /TAXON_ID=1158023 /ORGANISM="Astrosyne radiata, Strain 13vi08-1A" /LENGTH=205 /DNA_ID=CAMNT_0004505211 /DNA_START=116 /DNA_END=733 /DNA_ORIENTATION=+